MYSKMTFTDKGYTHTFSRMTRKWECTEGDGEELLDDLSTTDIIMWIINGTHWLPTDERNEIENYLKEKLGEK